MTVGKFWNLCRGNRRFVLQGDDRQYTSADFWHMFRYKDVWERQIKTVTFEADSDRVLCMMELI